MLKLLIESLIFLLTSGTTLAATLYKVPIKTLQQVIGILILLLILSLNKSLASSTSRMVSYFRYLLLLLCALLVQLTVISTGGFYSPFLILFHLFALGTSFLLSFRASLVFLVLSLGVLIAHIAFDKVMKGLFIQDPGSALLYFVSFLTIIPLAHLLNERYRLKESLAKILSKQVKVDELIFENLQELVLVTDRSLRILSANDAVEKTLSLSKSEMLNKPIFDYIFLRDSKGNMVDVQSLDIDNTIASKSTRIMSDLYLLAKNNTRPLKVNIQIRPVANLEGVIEHITFVISDSKQLVNQNQNVLTIEEAQTKFTALFEELKRRLNFEGFKDLALEAELLHKSHQDLVDAIELESHPIKINHKLVDVSQLAKKALYSQHNFAQALNVPLEFSLPDFNDKDVAHLIPSGYNINATDLTSPYFTAPVDVKWFDIILSKLLNLAILLSSGSNSPKVQLGIERGTKDDANVLVIKVVSQYPFLSPDDQSQLFTQYYGSLASKTNLRFGSGLEGILTKLITGYLNIPLSTTFEQDPSRLCIMLQISKTPTII